MLGLLDPLPYLDLYYYYLLTLLLTLMSCIHLFTIASRTFFAMHMLRHTYILYLLAVYTELSVFTCSILQHVHAEMHGECMIQCTRFGLRLNMVLSTYACWVGGWPLNKATQSWFSVSGLCAEQILLLRCSLPFEQQYSTQNLCAKTHNLLAHLHDYTIVLYM